MRHKQHFVVLTPSPSAAPPTSRPLRVMVVEDGVIMSRDIQQRLIAMGYAIAGVAYNGEEAVRMFKSVGADLVLMDVNLKGKIDGITAAEEMRRHEDVPVVFVTGYSDAGTLARIRETNPFGFILKPFDERDLRSAVDMALYRHNLDQALRLSEERFRVISEIAADFAYSLAVAADGTLTPEWVTDSFVRMTGIPTEEFWRIREYVLPEDIQLYDGHLTGLAAGQEQATDYRLRLPDGTERWFRDQGKPIIDPTLKRVIKIVCAAKDITEARSEEDRLQKTRVLNEELPEQLQRHLLTTLQRAEGTLDLLSAGSRGKTTVTLEERDVRRFRKMLRLHQLVYRDHARTHLHLAPLVRLVIQDELREARLPRVTFDVTADEDRVELEQALNCALIVQELVGSALTQSYRDGRKGAFHVMVHRSTPSEQSVQIGDTESIIGGNAELKGLRSLGLRFVEMLIQQLHGAFEVSYGNGTTYTLRFPVSPGNP